MAWFAFATQSNGPPFPTTLINDQIELMDSGVRQRFHDAERRVIARVEAADEELYRGGLNLNGCGRVLSLLAGHGGSLVCLDCFSPEEVSSLSHATDVLDPGFVVREMEVMGFDPILDPLASYYWSVVEFIRACVDLHAGIKCERQE